MRYKEKLGQDQKRNGKGNGRVMLWFLALIVFLVLTKFFFIGSYYVGQDVALPGGIRANSLLIVSIQSQPKSESDVVLVEVSDELLAPATFVSAQGGKAIVRVGGKSYSVSSHQIKGKVIGVIKL